MKRCDPHHGQRLCQGPVCRGGEWFPLYYFRSCGICEECYLAARPPGQWTRRPERRAVEPARAALVFSAAEVEMFTGPQKQLAELLNAGLTRAACARTLKVKPSSVCTMEQRMRREIDRRGRANNAGNSSTGNATVAPEGGYAFTKAATEPRCEALTTSPTTNSATPCGYSASSRATSHSEPRSAA